MPARLFAALWVLLSSPALAMPGTAALWAQVGEEVLVGATGVRETRWVRERDPGGPHNRIQVHRYRGERPTRAALLYLPGTNMNGHAAIKNELHNLWLYLARRGVEVWALDYRTHFVPALSSPNSSPDSPREESHAFMKTWTLAVFVEDARVAAALARKETGLDQVFVAGFSRGVTIAFGLACTEPSDRVAGLVVLDGTFKRQAASDRYDFEAEREALFAKGRFSTDVARGIGWENRHRLMSSAAANPDAASENPEFDSVGDEVAAILYRAWRPGALADPVHGVSRVEVLARLLDGYDRFWPAIQNVEGRSIADRPDDPRSEIDDAWGELTLPILYFGATGMGPQWILDGVYSVVESGSEDVSLHLLEGYGHLDVLVGEHSAEEVYEPISRWIAQRVPSPSPAE